LVTFNKIKNIDELLKIAGQELGVINQIDKMIAYANSLQNTQSQQLSKTKNIYWDAAAQSQNLIQIFENLKTVTQGFFEQSASSANIIAALDMTETAIMSIYQMISIREIPLNKVADINNIMSIIRDTFIDEVSNKLQAAINKQPQEEEQQQQQNYENFNPEQYTTDYT